MKKIFAISVLSVLSVVGVTGAKADNMYSNSQTVFGSGSNENFNIATMGAVEAKFVPNENVLPMEEAEGLQEVAVDVQSGATISESQAEAMNSLVPSVGAVAGSFVPNVATTYKDDFFGIEETAMRPGLYTIMVGVDESGNKTFIWQAVQNERLISSVGGVMPN